VTRFLRPASSAVCAILLAVCASVSSVTAQEYDLEGIGYDKGNPDAPIFIVEFGDFGCSACALFATETMAAFQREFINTGIVRWKYVPFILGSFPNSSQATAAAECAAEQDSFWSMHDLLYMQQKEWNRLRKARDVLVGFATRLGLDGERFERCLDSDAHEQRTAKGNELARSLFIRNTPTFFINGRRAMGALPITEWRKIIAQVRSGG
jgi:protein-disulfide isomerase